ncbi:SpoIIE family protein phosphatase [Leptospira ilyithenensis]|uniref:Serine/threonine protein phosphatase n=1 Tax=Leptospira ilyithenensis TaxID=2484901 RepID=A0A4V3JWL7_9LEPT|nr:SpoIIE family protein phosphatase [Leptospira ilyithenensis]TGN06548.1 serine/threonine protein phosphatase [Leptospira ilyithenensis]
MFARLVRIIPFLLVVSCSQLQIQKYLKNDTFIPQKIGYITETSSFYNLNYFVSDSDGKIPFTAVLKNNLAFGFRSEAVWLRIEATNHSSSGKIIFDLGNAHLDEVIVYEKGNIIPIKKGGDFTPHTQWDTFSKSVAFELEWPIGEKKIFFVKTKSTSNISYTLRFFTKEAFYLKENRENMILGFFYGTIFIMVLYNLFIYFILKEGVYILYSISIFTHLCVQAYLNGILNQFLTYDHPEIHNRSGSFIICFSVIFGWRFAQQSLNLKDFNPRSHRILWVLISATFLYLLFGFPFLGLNYLVRMANLIAQIFVVSVFGVALLNYSSGNKRAKLFLLGWSTLLVGILLYTLMQNGLLPANLITIYSNQIGSTLEAGILSLALASKINQLKEEKVKAQEEALITLEEKVRERTKILDESLFNIRKDLNVAKRIQQTFFSQTPISDNRIKFGSFYQSMNEVGGDFYDMTEVNSDHYRIFIADATGHGIQAALITMAIKAEYESLKIMYDSPNDLIFHLNQIFINKYHNVQTIFTCAVCDIDLKKRKLYFASAGHPDQIHLRAGEKKILPRTGKIIGLMDHTIYKCTEYFLEEGDRIYLYTDGAFEQFNKSREIFGEQRLYEILQESDKLSLDESIRSIVENLEQFIMENSHQDDITIVGCEIDRFV